MLLDHRTYVCRPGTIRKQLALYQEYGLAAQTRHLGMPVAYLVTETGDVNCYVHIWAYENAADRERRRAAMQADPEWIEFMRRSGEAGYLVSQVNSLMRPAEFFPQPARVGG